MKIKGIFTVVFCLCVGFVFGQWTDNGNIASTDHQVFINGTNPSSDQISVDVTNARAGFKLKADGNGTNTDDFFVFSMRNDLGDVVTSVRDASEQTWNEMMKFKYLDKSVEFSNNSVTNVQKLAIGLGTKIPTEALEVKGQVLSQEVKVVQNVADYVFEEGYEYLSLEELEKFINKNNHLPNVISQKEVEANNGELKLGDFSVSLLEKIEELTLHVINMNKRLKQLEAENAELKAQK